MPATNAGTIRTATVADAQSLASIHVASWRESYAGILPDSVLSSLSVQHRTAMWRQVLSTPRTRASTVVHVLETAGEMIGFGSCGSQRAASLHARGYDGEISAIYVSRAFQRRGIGTQLMMAMASDLLNRGCRGASLWVLRDNASARRFYERLGGQVIAEREHASDGTVFREVAYGWENLVPVSQFTAR